MHTSIYLTNGSCFMAIKVRQINLLCPGKPSNAKKNKDHRKYLRVYTFIFHYFPSRQERGYYSVKTAFWHLFDRSCFEYVTDIRIIDNIVN